MTTTRPYRYQLPKKARKTDCPDCGPRHRRTLSRYVDTRTGEPLPEIYGRCDRESNCGYHLSPYHKTASGMSYADEVYQQSKNNNPLTGRPYVTPARRKQPEPNLSVYSIPDEVFEQSIDHYDKNQLVRLLSQQFGQRKANLLLRRFQVGTSSRWPGACVFWYIDEQNRKRGGQIKLFGPDWHTEKYVNAKGEKKSKTSWVHSTLTYDLEKAGKSLPHWLVEYNQYGEYSPCLFGLPQLATAPIDTPIAVVEAPKTAIICTAYFPDFIWLAVGALSYLNTERLAPIRGRKIILYPDLNAYYDRVNEQGQKIKGWSSRADELRTNGFDVEVSEFLEQLASDEQKQAGLDLADYLLTTPATVTTIAEQQARPGSILKPDESQLERLTVEPCDNYPPEWET